MQIIAFLKLALGVFAMRLGATAGSTQVGSMARRGVLPALGVLFVVFFRRGALTVFVSPGPFPHACQGQPCRARLAYAGDKKPLLVGHRLNWHSAATRTPGLGGTAGRACRSSSRQP